MTNGKAVKNLRSIRRGNAPVSPYEDPSENVKALSEASSIRQDDLRIAYNSLYHEMLAGLKELVIAKADHITEISNIREAHAKEMRVSEAGRLDSIRQVDVGAVRTEASRALEAIQTLATTAARDAATLRDALVNTANTIATQNAETNKGMVERISALERSSYEGMGKQRVADPIQAELLTEVKALREGRASTVGKGIGQAELIAYTVAALAVGGFFMQYFRG